MGSVMTRSSVVPPVTLSDAELATLYVLCTSRDRGMRQRGTDPRGAPPKRVKQFTMNELIVALGANVGTFRKLGIPTQELRRVAESAVRKVCEERLITRKTGDKYRIEGAFCRFVCEYATRQLLREITESIEKHSEVAASAFADRHVHQGELVERYARPRA